MTGVIWFVQLVHYPLFNLVGEDNFVRYEALHNTRTGLVVAPAMLAELGSSLLLVILTSTILRWQTVTGLILTLGLWASTWLLQVPQHTILTAGFDANAHSTLVTSNWLRTVFWTLRSGLVVWWLVQRLER
jgi:hypothetical protein